MARIRSLKPELFESESLGRCSRDARYLFVGLIAHADDYGNQRGVPRLIVGKVYPYDEDVTAAMVGAWLMELAHSGAVLIYEVGGGNYLHLRGWSDHQRVDHRGRPHVPGPEEGEAIELRGQTSLFPGISPTPREDFASSSGDAPESLELDQGPKDLRTYGSKDLRKGRVGDSADSPPTEIEAVEPEFSSEVLGLCKLLADLIGENGVKRPTPGKKWHNTIRLMIERDGWQPESLEKMIRWTQDHEYWRGRIQSPEKLRANQNEIVQDGRRQQSRSKGRPQDAARTARNEERRERMRGEPT